MKRLLASVMIVACFCGVAEAKKKAQPQPQPVVVQQPAPLTGIPIVGTVVQGSLRFAETLIYSPFELFGYRR